MSYGAAAVADESEAVLGTIPSSQTGPVAFEKLVLTDEYLSDGVALADIDGDGLPDIVAGKRRWAHGPDGDIEPNAPPVVYWFRQQRDESKMPRFVPHRIDDGSGVGVQIRAVDVDGDGRVDVVTTSKLGTFLFRNLGPRAERP